MRGVVCAGIKISMTRQSSQSSAQAVSTSRQRPESTGGRKSMSRMEGGRHYLGDSRGEEGGVGGGKEIRMDSLAGRESRGGEREREQDGRTGSNRRKKAENLAMARKTGEARRLI